MYLYVCIIVSSGLCEISCADTLTGTAGTCQVVLVPAPNVSVSILLSAKALARLSCWDSLHHVEG